MPDKKFYLKIILTCAFVAIIDCSIYVILGSQQIFRIDNFSMFFVHSNLSSATIPVPSTKPTINIDLSKYDVLVAGAGLSGAVLAERHASLGHRVLVIDKRNHIAGNCYDYIDEHAQLRVNKYGAHLFHTNSDRVWQYVNQFGVWMPWEHRVLAYVDGKYVPVPVNIRTVNTIFGLNISSSVLMDDWLKSIQITPPSGEPRNSEEMALSRVGRVLYDKIFSPYTKKQWNTSAADLDPSVTGRIPIRNNFDDRYFSDKYQALPRDGYTMFVESLLSNPRITTNLNVDYFDLPENNITFIYYAGPVDRFFDQEGLLEYRSLRFERIDHDNVQGTVLPVAVVNYPSLEFPYTREVEYKHFLNQNSTKSVIIRAYPMSDGEPYYPVPKQRNNDAYERLLLSKSKEVGNVKFVGRLATYRYINMDEAIAGALRVFQRENNIVHIAITIFREYSGWVSRLCDLLPGQAVGWFVFLKDPQTDLEVMKKEIKQYLKGACNTISVTVVDHRQNVGREGLAWLDYMLNEADIGAYNVFLQGNPETPLESVAQAIKLRAKFHPFKKLYCGNTTNPPPDFHVVSFFEGAFRNIIVDTLKLSYMCLHFRGEFAVTGDAIVEMTKKWEEFLIGKIIPKLREGNDPPMGHVLERLWVELFGAGKGLS